MSGGVSLVTDFLSSILRGNYIKVEFPILFHLPHQEKNLIYRHTEVNR